MVKVRDYTPADKEAVLRAHAQLEARLCRKMDLPDLDKKPVMSCKVVEFRGQVVAAWYLEATIEVVGVGTHPALAAALARESQKIYADSQKAGIRFLRIFVPQWMSERFLEKVRTALSKVGFYRQLQYDTWEYFLG